MAVHEPLSPEDERLFPLVAAIADGTPVAWPPVSTPLVERLRHVERLVRGHDAVRLSASNSARSHETLLTEARNRNAGGPDTLRVHWGSLLVFEKIGRGSFGDVYRAWDPRLDREVALKLIPEDLSAGAASPVIEEGRLLALVRHPNVMTVYGADRCDGRTGIWTEYIRGETLAAEVARRGPLPAPDAVRIGIDVCAALGAVHAAGLLHRDVKAQNILRDTGGRIVLGDFGTGVALADDARMSDPQIAGTPLYLAPEVMEGAPATIASDLYGAGVLLYFLLTATFPVRGSTLAEIRSAHARGVRVPLREACPGVPDALARIVETLLAPNPDDRYQSAADAEQSLGTTLSQPATGQARGRRLAMSAIAVASIVVASLVAVVWRQGRAGAAGGRSNAAPFAVKAGDWIVVSELDNHTGESVLDGTLRNALERELEYSDFVRVAQRDRIEDALKLLQRPVDSPLSRDLAVALAQRDGGLRAVMSGGIAKDPGGYALRLEVIDPATGRPVTTRSDRAATLAAILPRVRAQTLLLREALGEPVSSIERSRDAFRRSALPTLEAMSMATQVRTMVNLRPGRPVATWMAVEKIGRQIMQEDDSFAYGPLVVAWSLSNQGRRPEGIVYAERALQLAGNATPQERYFILGTVHRFRGRADGPEGALDRGEVEKATAALEALFALQPDHYAVRNNLRGAYRLLGRDRDIAWMNQRLADARPWSVTENLAVARQLLRDGNVEAARRYGARAEAALSPATAAPEVDDAASVRLFTAYIAWAMDDPDATIQALDRAAASAGTLAPPERRQLAVRLAAMYAAVGRLHDAQRTLDAVQPDPNDVTAVMSLAIARAALHEDAPGRVRLREFIATCWREPLPPTAPALSARRAPFLIEAGLLDDAERDLEWFNRRTAQTSEWGPTVPRRQFQPFEASTRAAIVLKRGRAAEAVAVLREQMPVLQNAPPWVFGRGGWHTQYAAAKLAEGLEAVGKLPDAIAVLEEAMSDRVALTIGNTPHRWLRANAELARLYRQRGQQAKAREIETRLSRLLILADADHPLAGELKSAR